MGMKMRYWKGESTEDEKREIRGYWVFFWLLSGVAFYFVLRFLDKFNWG